MCLVGPCDVRACHQGNRDSPVLWVLDQLMDRPIFEHEAQQKHEYSQGVVDDCRVDFVGAEARPYPAKKYERRPVDDP